MPMLSSRKLSLCLPLLLQLGVIPACASHKEKADKKALEQKVQVEQDKNAAIQQEKTRLELEAKEAGEKLLANENKLTILSQDKGSADAERVKLANANLELQSKLDSIAKELKALDSQLTASSLLVKKREQEIASLTKQLTLAKSNIEKLSKEKEQQAQDLLASEQVVAEKNAELAKLSADLADTIAGSTNPQIALLRDQVASAQKELEGARAESLELSNNLSKEKDLSKDLARQIEELNAFQFHADPVQVFLANAGKDSLFVVEPDSLAKTYSISSNKSCTFILNINRSIDVVRGDAQNNIPRLANRTLLPLKASYQKVAVCKEGDKIEAQVENGSIYQSIPSNAGNSIQLVSARENSSCDGLDVNKDLGIFAATYQQFYPYRGDIDGIETIDLLRPSSELLRYNMGSSAFDFRGSSCAAVLADGVATDLSLLACRLALGQDTGAPATKGCFTEAKEAGSTQIKFTSAQ